MSLIVYMCEIVIVVAVLTLTAVWAQDSVGCNSSKIEVEQLKQQNAQLMAQNAQLMAQNAQLLTSTAQKQFNESKEHEAALRKETPPSAPAAVEATPTPAPSAEPPPAQ